MGRALKACVKLKGLLVTASTKDTRNGEGTRNQTSKREAGLVCVLIPTWNRKETLSKNLEGVYHSTYKDLEVLVVDNGSTDGTAELVRERFPAARIIRSDVNQGPVRARNIGLKQVRGDFVVFLDDDCCLEFNAIEKMVSVFDRDASIGAVAFKITSMSTGETLTKDCQYACKNLWTGASGIRREIVDKIGGFTKFAFAHGDEFDYSVRIHDLGFRIHYDPSIEAFDLAVGRTGHVPGWRIKEVGSWLLVFANNFPLRASAVFSARVLVSFGLLAIREKKLLDYFSGIWQAIQRYPEALRERHAVDPATLRLYCDQDLLPDTYNVPIYRKMLSKIKKAFS